MRNLSYTEAIREAHDYIFANHDNCIVMGLGATDSGAIDGTLRGLVEKYPGKIWDTPVSEFATASSCIGLAINNISPIISFSRVEFAMYAFDSICTQAAKWYMMFSGEGGSLPIVFRTSIGRALSHAGQHSGSYYPLFANTMGLKVVVPSTPKMARDLLYSCFLEKNPTVFLEPRWCFSLKEDIEGNPEQIPLDKARIVKPGSQLTLVTYAEGVADSLLANQLVSDYDLDIELIDLVSINPLDYQTIFDSVNKTKNLLVVDMANSPCSLGSDIIAKIALEGIQLDQKPRLLSCPHIPVPCPTIWMEDYFPTRVDIANAICNMLGKPCKEYKLSFNELHFSPKVDLSILKNTHI